MAEATTHATTEAAGGHAPAFPPFESTSFVAQLIWLAIAFGLLFWLMSKVALPRVAGVIRDRAERITRDLDEAQAMRRQSEEAGAAYETALAQARARAQTIAQETRDALSTEAEVRRKALEGQLAEKMSASEATIRSRTDEAMSSVRGIAADLAGAIVERLTGRVPERPTIEAVLDRSGRV